ncbi:hypothetical protein BO70DRAFT_390840 [Aspergillus heteromorphus CBS 117.55]|uniref:Box C/D snoRNA protein 1 n=1 Tax=Aspergillus heteromorphus CBS 117.55 TaxID=1448321 RepID=A0A317UVE7_9EURO|nr:uncharacterized protein BO70DRAFT_390840 [Aspergillus heteromorphus CBS 117.55]PWY65605.1 hypothetical protein BO70DRAFT_390840 [Aspergillus heteromorphus CBS 117.55]
MSTPDSPLSDLCTICHIQPPKYRCPRCSIRTCSLPCTRRHKLWSQCSGVRDPAAYLRRNELATEASFDRDFNFITGIERSIERAGRDVENRGIKVGENTGYVEDLSVVGLEDEEGLVAPEQQDRKRKRGPPGAGNAEGKRPMMKGEAAFLRRAESAGAKVVRAPKGMSRNKMNESRWLPKQQALTWTVEWITGDGQKTMRTCMETSSIADSYDRTFPLPKEEKKHNKQEDEKSEQKTLEEQPQEGTVQDQPSTTEIPAPSTVALPDGQPETSDANAQPQQPSAPSEPLEITSHRDVYFYLHRPRTTTKHPVLIPLSPAMTITSALRDHTVLEFPTIYTLSDSPDAILSSREDPRYILEEEYIRTHQSPEESSEDSAEVQDNQLPPGAIDLADVDETKVLEVLTKDLFEPTTAA